MIEEVARVFLLLAAGEALARIGHIPVPGPVIALVLLYCNLTRLGRIPDALDTLADRVLQNFGLFFVPAGVGVVAFGPLLRTDFVAIAAAILGGTAITIGVTAFIVDKAARLDRTPVSTHARS